MDKKIIVGIIKDKLEIIQEQFGIIQEYQGKIPAIELDLLMSNIRDLYELFINLQKENSGIHVPASTLRSFSILGFEPVPEPPRESEPPVSPEPRHEIFTPPPQPEPAYQPPVETNHEPHEPGIHQDLSATRQQKSAFDLFSENSPNTLADRFKEPGEKRVADRLQEHRIIDLRTTIGINDKFLFINELFDGNMRIYEEAVNKLNDCGTVSQADLLLLDLKIVYNWDSESPTVKKFVELARRKF